MKCIYSITQKQVTVCHTKFCNDSITHKQEHPLKVNFLRTFKAFLNKIIRKKYIYIVTFISKCPRARLSFVITVSPKIRTPTKKAILY